MHNMKAVHYGLFIWSCIALYMVLYYSRRMVTWDAIGAFIYFMVMILYLFARGEPKGGV
jgi:hypothetical protein